MDSKIISHIETLRTILHQLIGFHKKLLELVRSEKEALVQADLKAIESATHQKQSLIEEIYHTESARLKLMGEFAAEWKIPLKELSFLRLIEVVQGKDIKKSEQLRNSYQTVSILVQRIIEQNKNNKILVENSLNHILQMKKNVIQELEVHSSTYTPHGQKTHAQNTSRLISKEA